VNDQDQASDALTGTTQPLPDDAESVLVNNRMRRAIGDALSIAQLHSDSAEQRLAAATHLQQASNISNLTAIEQALALESDDQVRLALQIAKASLQISSPDAAERMQAIDTLGETGSATFRPLLLEILTQDADGAYAETDASVRDKAAT